LVIYFTVKIDGFQNKPAVTEPATFLTLIVVKELEKYCTRILEENKDRADNKIVKLQNHIQRLRDIINKHEGDDDTITYKFTMLEAFHIHVLIDAIDKSK
jgi:hypothetical protein